MVCAAAADPNVGAACAAAAVGGRESRGPEWERRGRGERGSKRVRGRGDGDEGRTSFCKYLYLLFYDRQTVVFHPHHNPNKKFPIHYKSKHTNDY